MAGNALAAPPPEWGTGVVTAAWNQRGIGEGAGSTLLSRCAAWLGAPWLWPAVGVVVAVGGWVWWQRTGTPRNTSVRSPVPAATEQSAWRPNKVPGTLFMLSEMPPWESSKDFLQTSDGAVFGAPVADVGPVEVPFALLHEDDVTDVFEVFGACPAEFPSPRLPERQPRLGLRRRWSWTGGGLQFLHPSDPMLEALETFFVRCAGKGASDSSHRKAATGVEKFSSCAEALLRRHAQGLLDLLHEHVVGVQAADAIGGGGHDDDDAPRAGGRQAPGSQFLSARSTHRSGQPVRRLNPSDRLLRTRCGASFEVGRDLRARRR